MKVNALFLFLFITGLTISCKKNSNLEESKTSDFPDTRTVEVMTRGYGYRGLMPKMKEITAHISFPGRTVRVEGIPIDNEGNTLTKEKIKHSFQTTE